ncbi:MAG: alpha-2-macroglobulin [Prolixibacteraceae bacterium]|nr:alpha-2-macroglobulin [Burkholderiales bacterium]
MKSGWYAGIAMLVAGYATAAQVEMFSPQGEVKGVRQVAVRFSEPMVAFGDPRLPEPFEIDCPAPGAARWADQKNWVYDFARDLPAGLRCSFRLKPDLVSLEGNNLEADQDFAFSTGGPAIVQMMPYEGNRIDEEQIFLLGLDAPANEQSIVENAYCDIGGTTERVPVRVIEGEERRTLLATRRDFVERFLHVLFKDGREIVIDGRPFGKGTRFEQFLSADGGGKFPIAVLQCKRRLPNNAKFRLVWGKGIVSQSGVPTSQDQVLAYEVRDTFQARFICDRVNKDAQCLPILPMRLAFTAPVPRAAAAKIVMKAQGKTISAGLPDNKNAPDFVDEVFFNGPFPERSQFAIDLPAELSDDAGRKLVNQRRFPLLVRTDEYPPLAKFPARFGIIEAKGDGMMPVTLRNLEALLEGRMARIGAKDAGGENVTEKADAAINWLQNKLDESKQSGGTVPGSYSRVADGDVMNILDWMKRLRQMENERWRYDEKTNQNVPEYRLGQASIFSEGDRVTRLHVPKPDGARAFEVVGIPLKKPGFYVVELASPRLGAALLNSRTPYYVQSAALVTNLAVHFKWGRESSLVWVTALDSGAPVAKALVSIQDCSGKVFFRGPTDAQGRARVAVVLPERERLPGCVSEYDRQIVVSARLADDLSFVMSDWNEGIARWRFNLRAGGWNGPFLVTTVFDRTLLRAGETVSMKHYYRRHEARGFSYVPVDSLPKKIAIVHQGSGQKYEVPVQWDPRNIAQSTWKIPEGAKKGTYFVQMTDTLDKRPGARGSTRLAGSFRVEEFRVPLMKAQIIGPRAVPSNPASVDLDVQLRYLAGGPAAFAPVKVRAVVRPKSVVFPDYDGFAFANGKVVEGLEQAAGAQWFAGEYELGESDDDDPVPAQSANGVRPLRTIALGLDGAGAARVTLPGLPAADSPQEVNAELEYSDPNGEVLTTSTRVPLWPSRILLGIKPDAWTISKDALKFQVLALDLNGKPVKQQQIDVQLYVRNIFSHRKRLIGGFYGYQSGAEIRKVDSTCQGKTDDKGRVFCAVKPPVSGNIVMGAVAKDKDGNFSFANASAWVAGNETWWFDQANDDRIDLIPERKRYEPGQTAQFQVRMPFRQGTALVTVEREGVVDSFVQQLSGNAPVINVALKGNYAPNVFVSVLVVRGRVSDVQPTALVDLGKPAFKMGVAEISVGWRAHELGVKVSADKAVYKVREKARISVQVTQRAGGKAPKSGEVAIVAVDEGLLELLPNDSWKLLEAMMQPRGIEVDTSTASMQVVGKRHYGRKALAHGGGGGNQTARELFDTLLLWKGRVPLDDKGRATVEIPLNDSLTSFRVIAVADSGIGLFGTGQTSIRATQDLMVLSGLPPLVREGDRFEARFTVRNASLRQTDVEVNGNVAGQALPASRVTLAPGEAREVGWEVIAPINVAQLRWDVAVTEVGSSAKAPADRLRVQQKVIPAVPVRTFQTTLAQLEQPLDVAVKIPGDAVPGRGGIRVALSPKLADDLPGVREYMSLYAYTCLEQRASRAVALRDKALWGRTMDELPAFLDRDGFVKYFASERLGSDTLTAYVLAIASEAGWEIPAPSLSRMQGALRNFVTGRTARDSPLQTADLTIRKVTALEALSRYQPIEPNLLDSIDAAPNLWPTSAVLDWQSLMKRGDGLRDREKHLAETEQILRSRLNFQGTTMGFSTERLDYLWWLMISGDVNANRMLLAVVDDDKWREDIPQLVRGTLGRQQHGRWNTTVANAWGVLAMERFSAKFESEPVAGQVQARLETQQNSFEWDKQAKGGSFEFNWPAAQAILSVSQKGSGKPWVTVQSRAAIPLKQPLASGYRINRTVTPVEAKVPGELRRGDTVRVRLEIEAQSDMSWVVVDDPVPGGAAILGTGLGRDSQILASDEKKRGFVWPAFEERSFDAFHAYYRFVPKGTWVVEYTVRLNNPGRFELPPTRVEAMYAPEMFGELPNEAVTVNP